MPEPINSTVARMIREANDLLARGELVDATEVAQKALVRAVLSMHRPTRAVAHYTLANILWSDETASAFDALSHARSAEEYATPHSDEYYLAQTLQAKIHAATGEHATAYELNTKLLQQFRTRNNLRGQAEVLRNLGDLALQQGNLHDSRRYFEESLALQRGQLRDRLGLVGLLLSLGIVAFQERVLDEARRHWEEALTIARENNLPHIAEMAKSNLLVLQELTADEDVSQEP